ncbi:substrate-binding domain-containing protein [Marinibaculum pumilum]|uniref:Substrate-binding domain-containing protein n=1 Tax=Marinibaculum pumilum TaxID=1766165 RepID=A0ABV7L7I9_9PROT
MKTTIRRLLPLAAAAALALPLAAQAETAAELEMKALGTTEGINPVVKETFMRAAKELTPEEQALALKCWKDLVCETGRGSLTVALADGFGENVWRRVTHMEFVLQALSYPEVAKIIYTSARGDASKAISDMRSLIAQKVDVIATFPDAGPALLPTAREATEQGITVVPYIAGFGGDPGTDYLTLVAEDLCELGRQFVQYVDQANTEDKVEVVELGGTPGNPLSAAWQTCSEEAIDKNDRMELLGKADTNWTQEGSFEAMSGFLSQHEDVDAVLYEYADGFRGGVRAFEAANRPMDVIVTLRTDEQGLFCDWEKANNENFKIFFSSGGTFQSRIALTAAMMAKAGAEIPPHVDVPFKMKQVAKGMCNPDLPNEMPVSTLVSTAMLDRMFK